MVHGDALPQRQRGRLGEIAAPFTVKSGRTEFRHGDVSGVRGSYPTR